MRNTDWIVVVYLLLNLFIAVLMFRESNRAD